MFFVAAIVTLHCIGCRRATPVVEVEAKRDNEALKERLINANKYIASSEQNQIEGYVGRRGWNTLKLSCGAHLYIRHEGGGSAIGYEDTVTVRYTLSTLTGITIYTDRTEHLTVGRRQATVSLDEALLQLRHGSQACLISPSEAGHGVAGDGDRVPARTVLVYDMTVL
ncbi:MAG: FKBP-type peptidyl-prolyl cis-trans isomerase [bacterium P3]|nr:MAG: FKBP-type peptidyl-prolyl cis-trans isomerase [bacterium P3]KWW40659.1 MAG: FKBP-type peptidyl-prolyl cis-trans isomerase [bacterium F083]